MKIVQYAPQHFDLLRAATQASSSARSLQHRPFVDYYYATREWCRLYLAIANDGRVAAAMGLEHLPFRYQERQLRLGCASNLVAFRPGAGGHLFLHWVKSSDFTCVYGGSRDTHKIIQNQRWTYFAGVKTLHLNRRYPTRPGEPLWRRTAKTVVRMVAPHVDPHHWLGRLEDQPGSRITVCEEQTFTDDMEPANGPFVFRFCPPTEYLNWRYSTALSFVRYRLFRLLTGGITSGYVVLNERPNQLVVAQCDGADPAGLATGILLALAAATSTRGAAPEVLLTSAHTVMQEIFRDFGFRTGKADRPFALGSQRYPIDLDPDTSNWLINFDWIDNGLRPPFRDQQPSASADAGADDFAADQAGDMQ